jgi:hypothetical protein
MSCIRFTTEAQRAQLLMAVADDQPIAQFLSPQITEGKVSRVIRLSKDANYKIRESAALSYHAPRSALEALAMDPVESVRECVARNPRTPGDILDKLAVDQSQRVRVFVAMNRHGADEAVRLLL